MIIINTLFPLLAMMALGYMLKRRGMTSDEFLKTLDKLVYYIFFPVMLFWKTAKPTGSDTSGDSVQLRQYGPDGRPLDVEHQVNLCTTNYQGTYQDQGPGLAAKLTVANDYPKDH